jgi:hypothetical protein
MRAGSRESEQAAWGCSASVVFRAFAWQQVNEGELTMFVQIWGSAGIWNQAFVYDESELISGLAHAGIGVVNEGCDAGGTCKGDAPNEEGTA